MLTGNKILPSLGPSRATILVPLNLECQMSKRLLYSLFGRVGVACPALSQARQSSCGIDLR